MRLFSQGVARALALLVPFSLATTTPISYSSAAEKAKILPLRDLRATVDRFCGVNYYRSSGVIFGPGACVRGILYPSVYRVTFVHSVQSCTVTGTLGVASIDNALPEAGEISIGWAPGFPNTVLVRTFNSAGQPADNGFRLHVDC